MKKNLLFVLFGASILFTMNSCNSELNLDKELKFSKLTVEEQKAQIEQSGLDFVTAMEGMQNTKAMTALESMMTRSNNAVNAPMQILVSDIKNARKDAFSNFDRQMRVSYVDSEVWGEYTYNFTTEEMEQVKTLTNKIIVKFPATESSTTNNGLITVTYEESTVEIPDSDGEKYPSKMTFVMKIDSKEVMTADFSGTYYADGAPKKVTQKLKLDVYSWAAEIENDKKTASESYEFKKGTKIILKSKAEVKGTLTEAELQTASDAGTPENAISEFAIYFQVMDVAVKGGTNDLKAMVTEIKAISKGLSEKASMQKGVDILNKYMVCTAFFVDDNRKFADVELYIVESSYQEYDYSVYPYVMKTMTDYDMAPRFILSDGSKVDAEEYVQKGFDKFLNKIKDMENDFDF